MRPNQCRKGKRVTAQVHGAEVHGVISAIIKIEGVPGVRDVMVRWDGSVGSTNADPSDLRPEPRVPVESREKLERWLDD